MAKTKMTVISLRAQRHRISSSSALALSLPWRLHQLWICLWYLEIHAARVPEQKERRDADRRKEPNRKMSFNRVPAWSVMVP
jgi:hypothetical protein